VLPQGRLAVSVLAAPRTALLWPGLAAEIAESLQDGGARVTSAMGEWGRELEARTDEAWSTASSWRRTRISISLVVSDRVRNTIQRKRVANIW
jgi:hypothetical protein